ncbi:hypothetical protein PInf_016798 [Phytophthora infestans]|nr:hypothetical protein PInf_016798 [Phytophthora infestans]
MSASDASELIQGNRYVKAYRDGYQEKIFSDAQIARFLTEAKPQLAEWQFAILFQSLKGVPDLKTLAENMQLYLFREWVGLKLNPQIAGDILGHPNPVSAVHVPKKNYMHKTWEAYTLYYAERMGGKIGLEKVKALLDNDNPVGLL